MKEAPVVEEPKLAEKLEKMPYEPLLPIEKKLVLGSVLLGLFLLAVMTMRTRCIFQFQPSSARSGCRPR